MLVARVRSVWRFSLHAMWENVHIDRVIADL
jgi:hypothetical protein